MLRAQFVRSLVLRQDEGHKDDREEVVHAAMYSGGSLIYLRHGICLQGSRGVAWINGIMSKTTT